MNQKSLFTSLLLLSVLFVSGRAQLEGSLLSGSWQDMYSSSLLLNEQAVINLHFSSPMGVPNILLSSIEGGMQYHNTRLMASYSLLSIPGVMNHNLSFGVGKWLTRWLYIQAGLEARLICSKSTDPMAFQWGSRTSMFVRLAHNQFILTKFDHWSNMISGQNIMPRPGMQLSYMYSFDTDCRMNAGVLAKAGMPIRAYSSVALSLGDKHSIFTGIMLNPSGVGIGYAYQQSGIRFRIILETSTLFGLTPQSSFNWVR